MDWNLFTLLVVPVYPILSMLCENMRFSVAFSSMVPGLCKVRLSSLLLYSSVYAEEKTALNTAFPQMPFNCAFSVISQKCSLQASFIDYLNSLVPSFLHLVFQLRLTTWLTGYTLS